MFFYLLFVQSRVQATTKIIIINGCQGLPPWTTLKSIKNQIGLTQQDWNKDEINRWVAELMHLREYFYGDAVGLIQLFMEEPFDQNMEEIGNLWGNSLAMEVSEAALAYQTNPSKNILASYYFPTCKIELRSFQVFQDENE